MKNVNIIISIIVGLLGDICVNILSVEFYMYYYYYIIYIYV